MRKGCSIIFLATFLTGVAIFLSSCGNEKQKVYKVGILSGMEAFASVADDFKSKMTELGYINGKSIVYEEEKLHNDTAGEDRVAKKFVADKVDLIFAFPTRSALAAKAAAAGKNIPVIFTVAGIEGNNLVESLRRPGGNITGVRFPSTELTVKRLEFLHDLVPGAKRIYIAWDKNYPGISFTIEELRKDAPSMKLSLVEAPVTTLKELEDDLASRSKSEDAGIDAVLIMPTLLTAFTEGFNLINDFAVKRRLPIAGSTTDHATMGAAFSYEPRNKDFAVPAAILADKVLKGVPAGTIPVVSPEAHLIINYKTIQKLGLKPGNGFLSIADEIIRK